MKSYMLFWTGVALVSSAAVIAGSTGSDDRFIAQIQLAELEVQQASNVYEAIEALRHDWLGEQGSARKRPSVFLEMRCSELACLRWLGASEVEGIRFVSSHASQAARLRASEGGAIVVTLRTPATAFTPSIDSR